MSDKDVSVVGLRVKKFTSTEAKNEKDSGKLQIVLEADKDDVRVSGLENVGVYDLGDIIAALNLHQSATEPVTVEMKFPIK